MPILAPTWRLFYLAPFLVCSCYQRPLHRALWYACLLGAGMDLLASSSRFGLYLLSYLTATWSIFFLKSRFFEDSFTTLPLLTTLFAATATGTAWLLYPLLGIGQAPEGTAILIDCTVWPLADGLYAALCFALPQTIFGKPKRPGQDYFLS